MAVLILTALPHEARPLVERLRLRSLPAEGGFRLFARDDVSLIVSGPGRTRAAAAVALLSARRGSGARPAWLDVGIAGHGELPVGTPLLGHRIVEAATERMWYPVFAFRPPCDSAELLTVDRPVTDYPAGAAVDMEASAFFETATRFSTAELVHVVKVVSDTRGTPLESVTAARVRELVASHVELVAGLVETLRGLRSELAAIEAPPAGLEELAAAVRLSETERRRLETLLRRARAVTGVDAPVAELARAGSAAALLGRLEELCRGDV